MMESNNLLFKKPLLMWPSGLNVSLVWFLSLLGVKVLNLNLPKVQQVTIREFLWKPAEMERANFFVIKKVDNRTTVWTHKHLSNIIPILRNNCYNDKVYLATQNSNLISISTSKC